MEEVDRVFWVDRDWYVGLWFGVMLGLLERMFLLLSLGDDELIFYILEYKGEIWLMVVFLVGNVNVDNGG